jgi:hypothetical protein
MRHWKSKMRHWKSWAFALALVTGVAWFAMTGHAPEAAADAASSISPLDMIVGSNLGTAEVGDAF